jgi:hypothetical protein
MESGSCGVGALSQEQLLSLCRLEDGPDVSLELLDDLRVAEWWASVPRGSSPRRGDLANAAAMAACALGRLPGWQVVSLPFGYGGVRIEHNGWIKRDDLELFMTQLMGLLQPGCSAHVVRQEANGAVWEAIHFGLVECKNYDAWRPGMPSGSGWCEVVAITTYGLARSRPSDAQAPPAAPASTEPAGDSNKAEAATAAQTATDSDEDPRFPPMQFVDEQGQYDFGGKRLLWEIFRALYLARKRLNGDELVGRVDYWEGAMPSYDTQKQAINALRCFWRDEGRADLAERIKRDGGLIWFDHSSPC